MPKRSGFQTETPPNAPVHTMSNVNYEEVCRVGHLVQRSPREKGYKVQR